MTNPADDASLAKVKDNHPLIREDIANIVRVFAAHPDKARFLLEICATNEKLAETLLIFRSRLNVAIVDNCLKKITDQIFLHYVINTNGRIVEEAGADPFDVFAAATRYADSLNVGVRKGEGGQSFLQVNGKEEECPEWGSLPNWSDAWSLRRVGPVINRVRYGRNDVIPSGAFDFDQTAADHTLENAMIMADLASLAYFEPEYVKQQLQRWGFDSFRWIEDTTTDTQAFVCAKDKYVIVCFRGTSSKTDKQVDLKFRKTDGPGGHGRVHRGFDGAVNSVWDRLWEAVHDLQREKLFVAGHSLGAALALLAAFRLTLADHEVASVYAYGSPRVGNRKFAKAYNKRLGSNTFLHRNNHDIVTRIPPSILGYRHVGSNLRQFDQGHGISLPKAKESSQEKEYEELTAKEKQEVETKTQKAQDSIAAATRFLTTPPTQLEAGTYDTSFKSGLVDDHGMAEYLFKFACAIVTREWKSLKR